jgi:2'-5' RNA ligase
MARLLWAGVAGDVDQLERVAAATRSACVRSGVEIDGAKFRPHLTLARTGRPLDITRWLRVFDLYTGPTWRVDELALVQSVPAGSRGGARYEVRELFDLGGRPENST